MPVPVSSAETLSPQDLVLRLFADAGIEVDSIDQRDYPEETFVVVRVPADQRTDAVEIANEADDALADAGFAAFVTVRASESSPNERSTGALSSGVQDPRAAALVGLITSRSRTSEFQPSLSYIPDTAASLDAVVASRHHLIFGRRGAGKTALMVEAKRMVTERGGDSIWINVQTYRHESSQRLFLYVVQRLCERIQYAYRDRRRSPQIAERAGAMEEEVRSLLESGAEVPLQTAKRLIPRIQRLVQRYVEAADAPFFIFLDDYYYVQRGEQTLLLDMLHGCVRDTNVWLKVASIRHLTRWFQTDPPVGLQTGHDAALIDLDVTLQDPARAKPFLEEVLSRYAREVDINRLGAIFSSGALDRLVLASGAVPRDYLNLSAGAVGRSKQRESARIVGVQDVNQAAGDAAQAKIQELEDDLAANTGSAEKTLGALAAVREFCLNVRECTYFRVGFRDKERHPAHYELLVNLLEVRLVHLIDPSVSDARQAGVRAEVYMLDLSQYSGARLKQGIRVLELSRGVLVSRRTGQKGSMRAGSTARELVTIYRTAPQLDLSQVLGGVLPE